MNDFRKDFKPYQEEISNSLKDEEERWTIKGFIDISKNIYTISNDTKVVSKILELMIFPIILKFARENGYKVVLAAHQNHYPDVTFINKEDKKYAMDIKTTYRKSAKAVNGFTLGAYTGYFRNKNSNKNITFPYSQYEEHFVLGFIYTRDKDFEYLLRTYRQKQNKTIEDNIKEILEEVVEELPVKDTKAEKQQLKKFGIKKDNSWTSLRDKIKYFIETDNFSEINVSGGYVPLIDHYIDISREKQRYDLNDLKKISSVIKDIEVFLREKWKLASDKPGSGNTKNIGSIRNIKKIIEGLGPFTKFKSGKEIFNDYWKFYLAKDMARKAELSEPPYNDLNSYFEYRNIEGS